MSTAEDFSLSAATAAIRFGSFCLLPVQRVLLENDAPIRLGNRALDILVLLVERAGEFVSSEEIVSRVWPTTVVVEGNLRVHIAGLRKALGDGRGGQRYIVNVPNRGYSFIAAISHSVAATSASEPAPRRTTAGLPAPLHRIIGRDRAIEALSEQLKQHRLVTLVGAGGIGKTTIAVTVAAAAADQPSRSRWTGVRFVDLAPLADAQLVPSALAAVLCLTAVVDDSMPNLLAFLHDQSLLILLDNCEHVISAVADMVETILRGALDVHILATSREPLRAN